MHHIHPHLCALEDRLYHVHQALGGGGVAAVGNDDLAVRVAVAFELQHETLESAVLAAGPAEDVQFAHIAGLADDPDVETIPALKVLPMIMRQHRIQKS